MGRSRREYRDTTSGAAAVDFNDFEVILHMIVNRR